MRVIAAIVLVTFAASVGCSSYRWLPAEPKPDESTCAELVGQRVQVHVTADSTVVMDVERCEWPVIRGWVVEKVERKYKRTNEAISLDMRVVQIGEQERYTSWVPLYAVLVLVGGFVLVGIIVLATRGFGDWE